ncbi:MAG: bacillithiol system redox-active protein YtxJ [Flavobacteriales bacterium]|nr:bacillithiol system redox-active protein YtxJ [Flavobacteriales bacterium]
MAWKELNTQTQLESINSRSFEMPVLIMKHSTRCSISSTALNRMNAGMPELADRMDLYYLDILSYRPLSNEIAVKYSLEHQSPQVLLIQNGECIYSSTHLAIRPIEILEHIR